jgi:predicted CopG family antitoxin
MKQEKGEGYISNKYLRELVVKFNKMNINDTGEWCDAYERKLENKNNKKSITEDKYEVSKDFIQRKREEIRALHERYNTMTPEERHKFNMEFEQVKKDICDAFIKVINGRIISFKLVQSPAYEEIDDIRQEALMTLFTYINRYDETRNSSAFAFVTQLITNALNLYLSEMNERNEKEIAGLDFYENLNTIDDPYGEDN